MRLSGRYRTPRLAAVSALNPDLVSTRLQRARRHLWRLVLRAAGGRPRRIPVTKLFPSFDENQLRDIGLRIDQVVSIDDLCRRQQ
jgi:hypothetical protein